MEEPGRLQSMGSLRVGHNWVTSLSLFHFHALEKEMATHSSVLAWRIPRAGEPGGLTSMGSHRVRHDWSDLAAAAAGNYFSGLKISQGWLIFSLVYFTMLQVHYLHFIKYIFQKDGSYSRKHEMSRREGQYLFILYLKLSPLAVVKSQNMNRHL